MSQNGNLIINARGETRPAPGGGLGSLELQLNYLQMQLSRLDLARRMGMTHDDRRDTWKVFGYPDLINVADYWSWYERGGMATRIVDIYPEDTWKDGFILSDGDDRSDQAEPKSQFIQGWTELVERLEVWRHFQAVDILARLGRFAVLLIGAIDGRADFKQPVRTVRGVAYLQVYGEPEVSINEQGLVKDPQNPRFGKPEFYQINFGVGQVGQEIHWTRLIHVAENRLKNDLYGRPALQSPYNRLIDKEKIVGGVAEAFWLLVHRGMAIIAEEGFTEDSAELQNFQEQVNAFKHDLDRIMRLTGATKIQELGGDVADPRGPYDVLLSEISGTTGIPKRKLIGTEEGKLAGSQDERSWHSSVESRRKKYAEPVIARPFIDWLIAHGVLPAPDSGKYTMEWPNLFELTDSDRADIAKTTAEAIAEYAGDFYDPAIIMPPDEFAERYLGYVNPNPLTEEEMLDREDDDLGDDDLDGQDDADDSDQ